MASTDTSSDSASGGQSAQGVDMALEVVRLPVSDVDRAKRFYQSLGWRLDIDLACRPRPRCS
jgi:predicted enzyme related to lactoylglutathione lyase